LNPPLPRDPTTNRVSSFGPLEKAGGGALAFERHHHGRDGRVVTRSALSDHPPEGSRGTARETAPYTNYTEYPAAVTDPYRSKAQRSRRS
jgi:hypothetical protein